MQINSYHPRNNKSHYSHRPKIGVIAGMGPKSTAPFIDRTIHYFQKNLGFKNDEDFPYMNIISLPTPFRISEIVDKEITLFDLKYAIESLTKNGMSFLVIPCNTVHIYYDEYKKFTIIPILNIIDETVKFVSESIQNKEVSLLATEVTLSSGLYQGQLTAKGYLVILDRDIQDRFNKLLKMIKDPEVDEKVKISEWKILENDLIAKGAKTIISACTDLSFFLSNSNTSPSLTYFDSMDILANSTVTYYSKLNLRSKL